MEVKSIDLSKLPNTFTSYLISVLPTLSKKTFVEIIDIVKDAKNKGIKVSEDYIDKVVEKIEELSFSKAKVLKYIADIALKGSELGVISTVDLAEKLACVYGSKDEAIIKIIIAMNKKSDLFSNIKDTWEAADEDVFVFAKRLEPWLNRFLGKLEHKPIEIDEVRQAIKKATEGKAKLVNKQNKWTVIETVLVDV